MERWTAQRQLPQTHARIAPNRPEPESRRKGRGNDRQEPEACQEQRIHHSFGGIMTTQEAHDRAASLFGDHAITDEYQGQLSIMLHRILNGQAEYLTIGTGRTWTEAL